MLGQQVEEWGFEPRSLCFLVPPMEAFFVSPG